MRLRRRRISLGASVLAVLLLVTPVNAAVPLSASIGKHAVLLEGGQAVQVAVTVTCDPASGEVLEAFVYVTQEGNESQFWPISVVCDGTPHTDVVRVPAYEESPFHKGKARASAYILFDDPDGTSVSPTRSIIIHKHGSAR